MKTWSEKPSNGVGGPDREVAHELEREVRRRAGALSTLGAALREPAVRSKPWWRFWS